MVTSAPDGLRIKKSKAAYVADVFNEQALQELEGSTAMGHVRYSTAGENSGVNAQPLLIDCKFGDIAMCHNGNLVNDRVLRKDLVNCGSIFRTHSDTEVILHLFARGQLVVIDKNGLRSIRPFATEQPRQCVFEHLYSLGRIALSSTATPRQDSLKASPRAVR